MADGLTRLLIELLVLKNRALELCIQDDLLQHVFSKTRTTESFFFIKKESIFIYNEKHFIDRRKNSFIFMLKPNESHKIFELSVPTMTQL